MFDIGSSLRDARLRQGLDFPELEARTKIRPKYLRALEEERFDILPSATYVKGFLRAYADALGLDGEPFVDEYNSRFTVGDDDVPFRARRIPPPRRERANRESRMALVALFAITVVTALVIAAWRFGGPEGEVVPGLAAPEATGTQPAVRLAGKVRLVVRALGGDSWMEIRSGSADGKLLYSGTLERGQRKAFQGRGFQLALAKPKNVVVRVNGNRVGLPAGTAFVVTAKRIARAS